MAPRHVIVDGSNLATEGRTLPSLVQLDQAVREFIGENPQDVVTVVVDASFGHRIDPSEVAAFEEAEVAGEVVSPPAGAIGRGDAFLLRIAEKTGATVLSNDSFQEFHGEHTWLFDKGRLVGGKPVPGVGWIFMDRSPVRGAKSREVTKEAKRKKREAEAATGSKGAGKGDAKGKGRTKSVDRAIARATEEVVEPKTGSKSHRRRSGAPPSEPVNEPLAFITFIAAHPLGSDVVGNVVEYSSHGAFVEADGAKCYIPLSAMGEPAPRRAREVVVRGETYTFVVQAFDPLRRGIELALPGYVRLAAGPTAETVEAEIRAETPAPAGGRRRAAAKAATAAAPAPRKRAGKKVAAPAPVPAPVPAEEAAPAAPVKKRAARKTAVPVATPVVEPPEPAELPAGAGPGPAEGAGPAEAPAPPTPRKRAVKETATEAPPAPTRKAAAAKKAAPAKKAAAAKKAAPAKKATPVKKEAAAKKVAAADAEAGERPPAKRSRVKKTAAPPA